MNVWRCDGLRRPVLGLLLVAWLLPVLSGCASRPAPPARPVLAAIVVADARLAAAGESGLVTVWREGRRLEGRAGLLLQPGDRVDTGPSATAVLHWPDGNALFVRPGSSGVIGSFTKAVGEFFALVRSKFAVETQFVRAATLSTRYLVRSQPSGQTVVLVDEGRVQVSSLVGAWAPVVVEPGSGVVAHPQAPQPDPRAAEDLARTREWVRQVERLAPAPPSPRTAGPSGTAVAVGLAALAGIAILANRDKDRPATSQPGRGDTAGTGTKLPAGTDTQRPPPLAAPAGLQPGTADERSAPTRLSRPPLPLTWQPVPGARDYRVVMQLRNDRGVWTTLPEATTTATQAQVPAGADGLLRWQVQARRDGESGPFSGWLYVRCTPIRLT